MRRRPVLRWHGGKWRLAPWIIGHFPPHRIYVEPFGGAASVLLRKPRAYAEIYNDIDGAAVNLFRVLRHPEWSARLIEMLRLTPFSRAEFDLSYAATDDPIEAARRLVTRSFMSFGSNGHNAAIRTGFRANSNRSGTTPAHDWRNYPESLATTIERLRGVVIECRPALEVMAQHDSETTLHYIDPPYLPATRSQKARRGKYCCHSYAHEMTELDHAELLEFIKRLSGAVVLSGYPSTLYDRALDGWRRIEIAAMADGARPRTEMLWINRAAVDAQCQQRLDIRAAA